MYVTKEEIRKARTANLWKYIYDNFPNRDITVYDTGAIEIDYFEQYPIWIGKDHSGYVYQEGYNRLTGNSIDFLMNFMDMTLPQAVCTLKPYFREEV